MADDLLADLKDGYNSLKKQFDDIDIPDFETLFGEYLPSKVPDYGFDADGNGKVSSLPPYEQGFVDSARYTPPLDDDETEKPEEVPVPFPPAENFIDSVVDENDPPKSQSQAPPRGYEYKTAVPASSKPAPTTLATVTRSAGYARPSTSYGYEFTLPDEVD